MKQKMSKQIKRVPVKKPAISIEDQLTFEYQLSLLEKNLKEYVKDRNLDDWHDDRYKFHPKEMIEQGLAYLQYTLSNQQRPNWSFLCQSMGINNTIYRRLAKESPALGNLKTDVYEYPLTMFKGFVAGVYEQLGQTNIAPSLTMFMLKELGLADQKQTQVIQNGNDGFTTEERDKIRSKLKAL